MFKSKIDVDGVQRAEYLCDYIDKVLEAFQAGVGIMGGAPEPITHDIARRLIWSELRRVVAGPMQERTLWLRIAGESSVILAAMADLDGPYDWTFRVQGPRREGDVSVAQATACPVKTAREVDHILSVLQARGCVVRDFTLGSVPQGS